MRLLEKRGKWCARHAQGGGKTGVAEQEGGAGGK